MPNTDDQEALERARDDAREGKSPSTQAGEFVREEIDHVREGKHGAASVKQAIAIGLSKARRAGVKLPPPAKGSAKIRAQAQRDLRKGKSPQRNVSAKRSRATLRALQQESTGSVSPRAFSQQARSSARRRGPTARHDAAEKAVHTKGKTGLRAAARKAARTRQRRRAA
jgi:poly-gamma-glutamate capsule biosynthesis protein CapA/YwtB (metallophosphatase superfamily)